MNIAEYLPHNTLTSYYHISISQFQFILRNVIQILLTENNGFILHASACVIDGKASLFTGFSGAGKSTVIKLLKTKYPALADDTVIIQKKGETFFSLPNTHCRKGVVDRKGTQRNILWKKYFLASGRCFFVLIV